MSDVLIIGAGAWGTALAIQAHRAGAHATLWLRDPARAQALSDSRHNPRLPTAVLPRKVDITTNLDQPSRLRLLAIPAQQLRDVARRLPPGAPFLICAKGMEHDTLMLPLDILAHCAPDTPAMVLSGPNFAHELAAGLPAAAVLAGADVALRTLAADLLGTPEFRLYGNDDPIGVQIGGAAKNVIAIAAGAVIGAGLGENARAALVTRGLAEIARLSTALGGRPETIAGLSGLGDLLLTCTGPASRNYALGHALGSGLPLPTALAALTGVAEGVATAPALCRRAAMLNLELPICAAVASLLDGTLDLPSAIAALLSRPRREE